MPFIWRRIRFREMLNASANRVHRGGQLQPQIKKVGTDWKCKKNNKIKKCKYLLPDFEHSMVVGVRWAVLSISETTDQLWSSHTTIITFSTEVCRRLMRTQHIIIPWSRWATAEKAHSPSSSSESSRAFLGRARNRRFTRQICSNCMIQSFQYGAKSLNNVSSIL